MYPPTNRWVSASSTKHIYETFVSFIDIFESNFDINIGDLEGEIFEPKMSGKVIGKTILDAVKSLGLKTVWDKGMTVLHPWDAGPKPHGQKPQGIFFFLFFFQTLLNLLVQSERSSSDLSKYTLFQILKFIYFL